MNYKLFRTIVSILYSVSIFIQENFTLIQALGFNEVQVNSIKLFGALIFILLNNLDLIPDRLKEKITTTKLTKPTTK